MQILPLDEENGKRPKAKMASHQITSLLRAEWK